MSAGVSYAQPPGPPSGGNNGKGPPGGGPPGGGGGPGCWPPPCIPIDNGIEWLLIAGVLLGVKTAYDQKNNKKAQAVEE